MKRNIVLSLALVLVLFSSISFAPTPEVDIAQQQDFNASFDLKQLTVVNVPHGDNGRFRTVFEIFEGTSPVVSDWDGINGAQAWMTVTTNFEIDLDGNLSGRSHSTLALVKGPPNAQNAIILDSKGTITGSFRTGIGTITEKFNTETGTGNLAKAHATGNLSGTFSFFTGTGSGTLTGQHK